MKAGKHQNKTVKILPRICAIPKPTFLLVPFVWQMTSLRERSFDDKCFFSFLFAFRIYFFASKCQNKKQRRRVGPRRSFCSERRAASMNNSWTFSRVFAEHSINAWALICAAICRPSSVVTGFRCVLLTLRSSSDRFSDQLYTPREWPDKRRRNVELPDSTLRARSSPTPDCRRCNRSERRSCPDKIEVEDERKSLDQRYRTRPNWSRRTTKIEMRKVERETDWPFDHRVELRPRTSRKWSAVETNRRYRLWTRRGDTFCPPFHRPPRLISGF